MTPEQAESILQHRQRMAAINTAALNNVNSLANLNTQAILHHSIKVTEAKQKAIDELTKQVKEGISGQGAAEQVS